MKFRTILPFALVAALLAGCAEDDAADIGGGRQAGGAGEPVALTIAPESVTRTVTLAGNAWEGGEEVAVSIGGTVKKYVVDATDHSKLQPAPGVTPFTWSGKTETKTVTAWYPYAATKTAVTVPADQSTEAKLRAAIMLEATVSGVTYGTTAALTFTHRTAKVTINPLDTGDGNAMHATATVSLTNLSGVSSGTTVTPLRNADNSFTAIIAPQTIAATTAFASIGYSGSTWAYKPGATTFAAASAYTYNVSYALATAPALGDLYYSDGTYSSTLVAGKTPIGVIAYLGTDAFTETGTTVGGNTFAGHGLVLCLKNAASNVCWSTETSAYEFGESARVNNLDALKRTTDVSGYTNTATLAAKADAATKYPAAYQAKNYTGLAAPAGTTGWFLPSAQQWVRMMTGLGGLAEGDITWVSWFNNDHSAATAWETALAKAGAGNYDSMTDAYLWYWSSSETSASNAVNLGVDARGTGDDYGFRWYYYSKGYTYDNGRVRPVLAF